MTQPKANPRSTIKEVAELAGVAKTTVSHAISGKRPVAPETRERIYAAMRQLRFKPSLVARRLAGSPSHAIALIYPLASLSPAAVELRFITSIGEVISLGHYTFLTLASPMVGVDDLSQIIQSGLVDGAILMRIQVNDQRVKFLRESDTPFVMIGRTRVNKGLTLVDLDGELAIEMAVKHLIELGHQQIAFMCPDDVGFGFAYRLVKGYEKSCRKHALRPVMCPASWSDDAGYRAMQSLLAEQPNLTGVIIWSDVVSIGAVSALRDSGRAIPQNMSVISFDKSDHLLMASGDLTVIDTRPEEIGVQAARMLLSILKHEPLAQAQVLVPPQLTIGKSTSSPPRR